MIFLIMIFYFSFSAFCGDGFAWANINTSAARST